MDLKKVWLFSDGRIKYLMEVDVALTLHHNSLETRYSYSTRNLDYIYTNLPIIHSKGDIWEEIIRKYELGIIANINDVASVAESILKLSTDRSYYIRLENNIEKVKPLFTWENVIKELNDIISKC